MLNIIQKFQPGSIVKLTDKAKEIFYSEIGKDSTVIEFANSTFIVEHTEEAYLHDHGNDVHVRFATEVSKKTRNWFEMGPETIHEMHLELVS